MSQTAPPPHSPPLPAFPPHPSRPTPILGESPTNSLARELGSKWHIAWSLCRRGEVAYWQGHLAQARALYNESLVLFEAMAEREASSLILRNLARVCYHEGDYENAAHLLAQSLDTMREIGLKAYTPYTLLALGELARRQGDDEHAAAYYRESLTMLRENRGVLEIADRLEGLAKVSVRQGQHHHAACLFGAAQAQRTQLGTPLPPVEQADYDDYLGALPGMMGEEPFAAAWREGYAMPLAQVVDHALA